MISARSLAGRNAPGQNGTDPTIRGNSSDVNPRIVLNWPRAVLLFAVGFIFLGGLVGGFWLILLLLLWWAASRAVSSAYAGLGVAFRFPLHGDHVFCGHATTVEVVLANRGRWPVPWLSVEARFPEGVSGSFRRLLTIAPRGTRRYRFNVEALRRGVYRLGDAHLVVGDWFGLNEQKASLRASSRLVVYPPLPRLPDHPAIRKLPTGPMREPISPFRDDLPLGLRPYIQGDPPRFIDWKASARRGELISREFPRVRSTVAWFFLDLDTDDWDPLSRNERTEAAVQVAAALLWQERTAGRAAGLSLWGRQVEHDIHGSETVSPAAWLRVLPRADRRHALAALELLAGVHPAPGGDFLPHVQREASALPWGARIVCLVPRDTPELWLLAAVARMHGHPVTLLCFERRMGRPRTFVGAFEPEVLEVNTSGGIAFT